jgi:hypothetical protein
VVDAATLSQQCASSDFAERVRERAHETTGTISVGAIFRTDLVEARATAAEPTVAVHLAQAAAELVVEEQNTLIDQMYALAQARWRTDNMAFMMPTLSRPSVQVGRASRAVPAGPSLNSLLAAGLGAGLALGLLVASWRDAKRRVLR